ncbi:hypothetical protein WKW79_13480 [Variovorax robiniae]|uniref:Uncharacterized protein n=1 Tax=Variovorax robiniae TaxID=1836199 RepID=A0ABU8X7I1_9BURK
MRQLLLLRGAFNILFGLGLLLAPKSTALGGWYGVIDGVLGLGLAIALFRSVQGQWLFFVVLLDAMVRLVFGGTILLNPNITSNLFTGAFFTTAVVTVFIAMGITGVIYALLRAMRQRGEPFSTQSFVWPVVAASVCTALFGVGLLLGPAGSGERRIVACVYGVAFGLILLVAGLRSRSAVATA